LEVHVGSHNVNFHCDFLKLFLEVRECTSFVEICFVFFTKYLGEKKKLFEIVWVATSIPKQVYQKNFQKIIIFFFLIK
jgi:hypothetical protein